MGAGWQKYDPSDSDEVFVAKAFGLELPPKPKWRCHILPNGAMVMHVAKAPNAFWRLMQRLILGFRWERVT